jgi:hypothetical protein
MSSNHASNKLTVVAATAVVIVVSALVLWFWFWLRLRLRLRLRNSLGATIQLDSVAPPQSAGTYDMLCK